MAKLLGINLVIWGLAVKFYWVGPEQCLVQCFFLTLSSELVLYSMPCEWWGFIYWVVETETFLLLSEHHRNGIGLFPLTLYSGSFLLFRHRLVLSSRLKGDTLQISGFLSLPCSPLLIVGLRTLATLTCWILCSICSTGENARLPCPPSSSPPVLHSGNSPKGGWASPMFSPIPQISLSFVTCALMFWKLSFHVFCLDFSCFRQENKSISCYSILSRSGSSYFVCDWTSYRCNHIVYSLSYLISLTQHYVWSSHIVAGISSLFFDCFILFCPLLFPPVTF